MASKSSAVAIKITTAKLHPLLSIITAPLRYTELAAALEQRVAKASTSPAV